MAGIFPGSASQPPVVNQGMAVVGGQYCAPYPVDLTVTEKTISLTDGDYAVTDVNGAIVFKVQGKLLSLHDRRVLLDAAGRPILTLKQKTISAHRRWEAFRGDSTNSKHLLFSVKKSHMLQMLKTELEVFLAANTSEHTADYKIRGSFFERSCAIYSGGSNVIVAQMGRRYTVKNIVLGKDAFGVTVYPNVDYAFITALIVILDEINKDRDGRD